MEKWINRNTDNGFKNGISSLFQKDFVRIDRHGDPISCRHYCLYFT